MMHDHRSQRSEERSAAVTAARRWAALIACCAIVGVVWLGVLPAVSERPGMRKRIEHLEARGIDPSAMFYTELPAMDRILHRIEEFGRRYPKALWVPASRSEKGAGGRRDDESGSAQK